MSKWSLSREQKKRLIDALTNELPPLRAKVGISQGELATLIGISRQTYSSIECKKREMSWNTYLSLILFFDYNYPTHLLIRQMDAFPNELVDQFNQGKIFLSAGDIAWSKQLDEASRMLSSLDDQGLHTVKSIIQLEYNRCSKQEV